MPLSSFQLFFPPPPRLDLSLLVVTKALTQEAEDYENKAAHVELAKKMKKRDAATAPNVGDRVAYVIIKSTKVRGFVHVLYMCYALVCLFACWTCGHRRRAAKKCCKRVIKWENSPC